MVVVEEYQQVFWVLSECGVDVNVLIKLMFFGFKIDFDFCCESLQFVFGVVLDVGNFVCIDMEDYICIDDILCFYQELCQEFGGYVGIVLQVYFKCMFFDIVEFGEGINVCFCKGIYIELWCIVWKDYEMVCFNFIYFLECFFEQGVYVGIVMYDEYFVVVLFGVIQCMGLFFDCYEFQMLFGVDEEMCDLFCDFGYCVCVYVLYGQDWYLYLVCRLCENLQIVVYVMCVMLGCS